MFKKLGLVAFVAVSMVVLAGDTNAQNHIVIEGGKCPGKIYGSKDVTRRARIIEGPNLKIPMEATEHDVHGTVIIEAILCRTGRVTDIQVLKKVPFGVSDSAINAVLNVRFSPAELNFHSVSQRIRFELSINDNGVEEINPPAAAGRLVESVGIMGNRIMSAHQILAQIKTRPGEPFNAEQIKQDLSAILATGFFDKTATRAYVEEGARGGVGVIFGVVELPLISEVKFEGVKIDQSIVLKALEKEQINLRTGTPFNVEQVKAALRIIKQVLESNGQSISKVDLQIEHVTAMTINVIFVITNELTKQ